jgi:hypothetical protein
VRIADVSNTLFGPSFSSELVTVSNDVNNRLVRNSGVSHRTLPWDPSSRGRGWLKDGLSTNGLFTPFNNILPVFPRNNC